MTRFSLSFPRFSVSFTMLPFPHKNNYYFRKEFPYDAFCYSVRTLARIRQRYFSKHWWNGCMGRAPPQSLEGTVPQCPLGLRPCSRPQLVNFVIAEFDLDSSENLLIYTFLNAQSQDID